MDVDKEDGSYFLYSILFFYKICLVYPCAAYKALSVIISIHFNIAEGLKGLLCGAQKSAKVAKGIKVFFSIAKRCIQCCEVVLGIS